MGKTTWLEIKLAKKNWGRLFAKIIAKTREDFAMLGFLPLSKQGTYLLDFTENLLRQEAKQQMTAFVRD